MFRYEFDTKYLCWQISPSGDLTVGSSINALNMKLASKGEQLCDGWRGCFDFDRSIIMAASHCMDDKHRIVQTHPVSILSFSTQDIPEHTKAVLTKYFIENTDGIMALTKVSDDYINGVRERLKVAQNFETFYADELIKLAQNEALIRRILTYFPRWSASTVSSFLLWWGAVAGLPAEAIAQTVQNNPAEVKQKAQQFQSETGTQTPATTAPAAQTEQPQSSFDNVLKDTLRFEGGYVNDPKDRGGETNYGITRNTYEKFLQQKGLPTNNINMRNIPQEHIGEIYSTMYWKPSGCENLPPKVAQQVFDFAVNSGVGRAVQHLQTIVGAQADGAFGPKTQAAVKQYVQKHGEDKLAQQYVQSRREFIEKSTKIHPKFKKGLMNRINAMEKMISPVQKKASASYYEDDWTHHISDTDRYGTDRYDLLLSIRQTDTGYSIGFQINSVQLGVTSGCEYWHFNEDEGSLAKQAYAEIKQAVIKVHHEIEEERLVFALILPKFRRALQDIHKGYKEKSGISFLNLAAIHNPAPEDDWRDTIYGGRYPDYARARLKDSWVPLNTDDKSRGVQTTGKSKRDQISSYRYASAKYASVTKDLINYYGLDWGKIASSLRQNGCDSGEITEINKEFLQYFFHLNS